MALFRGKITLNEKVIKEYLADPVGPVSRFFHLLGDRVAGVARGRVHRRTGETARSINTDFRPGTSMSKIYEAEVSASYAVFFLEKGVRPHVIRSHGAYSMHGESFDVGIGLHPGPIFEDAYFGRVVHHPGFEPMPFLTTGLWSLQDNI